MSSIDETSVSVANVAEAVSNIVRVPFEGSVYTWQTSFMYRLDEFWSVSFRLVHDKCLGLGPKHTNFAESSYGV